METSLIFIFLVVLIFLTFNFINQRLQNRLYQFRGFLFLLVGVLLGEQFINYLNNSYYLNLPVLFRNENLSGVEIFVAIILGYSGFLVGLNFRVKKLIGVSTDHFKLSLIDVFLSILFVGGVFFLLINKFFQNYVAFDDAIVISLFIGITSIILSSNIPERIGKSLHSEGNNFRTLLLIPGLNNLFAVSFFGMLAAVSSAISDKKIFVTPVEWFLISAIAGLLFGFLFFIFLEREENENYLLISLIGIITFTSGIAYHFNLSPIFLNLLAGIVVGNLIKSSNKLHSILCNFEELFFAIILIYAGTLMEIVNINLFLGVLIIYIIIRYVVKFINGHLAYFFAFDRTQYGPSIGKGLNTQGLLALAIAINFYQIFEFKFSSVIFSAIVLAILINDLLSDKLIKNLLIDLNEIK